MSDTFADKLFATQTNIAKHLSIISSIIQISSSDEESEMDGTVSPILRRKRKIDDYSSSANKRRIQGRNDYTCRFSFTSSSEEDEDKSYIKEELQKISSAPFTRGQKENLYNIIGRPCDEKSKFNFDPNVFDAEIEEENNNNCVPKLSEDAQTKILNQYLLPLEECKSTLDKINQIDEEDLPDLDDVQFLGITYNTKPVATKPLINLSDIKTEFPSLQLDPDLADLLSKSSLQPKVKLKNIAATKCPDVICTYSSFPKIPRLKLRDIECFIKEEKIDPYFKDEYTRYQEPQPTDSENASISVKKEPVDPYWEDNIENSKQTTRASRHFMDAITTSVNEDDTENVKDSEEKADALTPYDYSTFSFRKLGEVYQRREVKVYNRELEDTTQYRSYSSSTEGYKWLHSSNLHEVVPIIKENEHEKKVEQFRTNMVLAIECCYEEGESFLDKVLILTKDFTTSTREPPVKVLKMILFDILLHCDKPCIVSKAYNLLQMLLDKHPLRDQLPFEWQDFETVVANICLPVGIKSENNIDLQRNTLALQYMVMAIERELLDRTITQQRQVNKSVATKWLSSESAFLNIRSILRWIFQSISFGEYYDLQLALVKLNICDNDSVRGHTAVDESNSYVPKVFPIFNKLLDLSLTVSKQPTVCAQRIADELSLEYNQLTDLTHKRFILEHISHPLLRMKLVNRILSYCNTIDEAGQLQDFRNLNDIVQGPFKALPPCRNDFTPPPSPSESNTDEVNKLRNISSEAVEELAMLLWHCINSYLTSAKNRLYEPTSRRALGKQTFKLDIEDREALKLLPEHVSNLEKRLGSYCEFTSRTRMYFMCLHGVNSFYTGAPYEPASPGFK